MKTYSVRGKQVVLDRELAALIGIPTGRLNEPYRRNKKLFSSEMIFQLTNEEFCGLKTQIAFTNQSTRGGSRHLPMVYTKEGISMLEKVLKRSIPIEFEEEAIEAEVLPESWNEGTVVLYQPNEDIKIDVRVENETVWLTQEQMCTLFGVNRNTISHHIGNIFSEKELEKNSVCQYFRHTANDGKTYSVKIYNLDVIISVGYRVKSIQGTWFRQWANKVIKQYVMRQGAYNYRLDLIERKYEQLDCCLHKEVEELREQVEFFVDTKLKQEYHFMDGEFIKASNAYMSIYRNASKSIIIIDNYIEPKTLALLNGIKPGVEVTLFSDNIGNYLTADELQKFSRDYPNLRISFKRTNKKFHDRYIILDYKTKSEKMFHCGPSSKDAGERVSSITLVTDVDTFYTKIDSMMESPNWYSVS